MATHSSDEGEIIESVEDLKATAPRAFGRNGVDRQSRPRSPVKTPDHDRSRGGDNRYSRSPRGFKRPRDDRDFRDQNGRGGDPRRFRVHYEDDRGDYRRQRRSYHDLDRPSRSPNGYSGRHRDERDRDSVDRYADRDRNGYPEKRPRTRSRSPNRRGGRRDGRYRREDRRLDRHGGSPRTVKYDDHLDRDTRADSVSRRAGREETSRSPRDDAKPDKGSSDERQQSRGEDQSRPDQYVTPSSLLLLSPLLCAVTNTARRSTQEKPKVEESFEEAEPVDEDAEIERRRKRREAILAKSAPTTPLLVHALHGADKSRGASPAQSPQSNATQGEDVPTPQSGAAPTDKGNSANTSDVASPASNPDSEDPSLGGMAIVNDQDLINTHGKVADDEDGPSAADYDPTVDMKEDGLKDERRHGNVGLHGELGGPPLGEAVTAGPPSPSRDQPMADDDDDPDDFNMFADDFDVEKYAAAKSSKAAAKETDADGAGLLEDVDKDGYYKLRIGELLNGRYQVQTTLGRGMFSGVVRAVDTTNNKPVAIKMMRNNDALRKGGFTEIAILQKINESDPEGRKHMVRFWRHFDHKGHLCMVFESLSLNLREVLKKFGNNVGINLNATRAYAHQIFIALAHMRKCGIVHADLKPDNILVSIPDSLALIITNSCRSMRAVTRSKSATWARPSIGRTLRRPTTRSRRTSSAGSTARRRSCWGCPTTTPSTCGQSAALSTSSTRARSCSRATVTTRCSSPSWKSGAKCRPKRTGRGSWRLCILTTRATLCQSSGTRYLARYVGFYSCACWFCCTFYPKLARPLCALSVDLKRLGRGRYVLLWLWRPGLFRGRAQLAPAGSKLRRNLHGPSRDPATMW